ncbi:hypothetical protein GCM10027347_52880 [Larkinella harenae]
MQYVDTSEESPVILSFCPGLRGLERGLERVFQSIRVAAYVEIEAFICENLLAAMEAGLLAPSPIWTNLKTFNPQPLRNRIDGIIGGYPCQPFSLAGQRKGEDDPRHLWPYIQRSIAAIKPVWCFFENVSGHLSMGYAEVYRSLRDMGYAVESGIYSAEEVGAPHERDRLFILAVLANPNVTRSWWQYAGRLLAEAQRTGETLVNANNFSCELSSGESAQELPDVGNPGCQLADALHNEGRLPKSSEWDESRQTFWGREEMADPLRFTGKEMEGQTRESVSRLEPILNGKKGRAQWPAGQGYFQYDYEPPRTVESRMVYTVNGYNFEEDLHRAIGNSVVEQTAEIAFFDLLLKHQSNSKPL